MSTRKAFLIACVAILVLSFTISCKKKEPETIPVPEPEELAPPKPPPLPPKEIVEDFEPSEPVVREAPEPTVAELNRQGVLKTVFFALDKYDLSEETRRRLRENAEWLKQNPKYNSVIEGHCDERGSIEYNLALGERRANSVRDYLSSLGLSASRLRLISYGEERPADPGHSERSWAKNRRAEFVIER